MQSGKAEREMREDMRKEDDLEIRLCGRRRPRRHLARAAEGEQRIDEDVEKRNEDGIERDLERNRLANQFFAGYAIARAELDRQHRRVSHAYERAERREEHHDGHRKLKTRHRVDAAAVAYERAVDDGVERVERHRDQRGPRVSEKKAPDLAGRQLFCLRRR